MKQWNALVGLKLETRKRVVKHFSSRKEIRYALAAAAQFPRFLWTFCNLDFNFTSFLDQEGRQYTNHLSHAASQCRNGTIAADSIFRELYIELSQWQESLATYFMVK